MTARTPDHRPDPPPPPPPKKAAPAPAPEPAAKPDIARPWLYKDVLISAGTDFSNELNTHGKDGWELVEILLGSPTATAAGEYGHYRCIFKLATPELPEEKPIAGKKRLET